MPSPICLVNGYSSLNGYDTTPSQFITISLADDSGVNSWELKCIGTDNLITSVAINALLSHNTLTNVYTFTTPAVALGSAIIFQSKINNAKDINGNYQNSYITNFELFSIGTYGYRLVAQNQSTEADTIDGWAPDINDILANGIHAGSTVTSSYLTTTGNLTVNDLETTDTNPSNIFGIVQLQTRITGGALTDIYLDNYMYDRLVFCENTVNTNINLSSHVDVGRMLTIINATYDPGPGAYKLVHIIPYAGQAIYINTAPYTTTTDLVLPTRQSITLVSDGTNWHYANDSNGIEY